ncbi:MAG: glycosyltransferase family 1 protein [Actinobacteria bacterium]|nr:glycosyltransferase family 1 protein [Actinomycetota bacterium]
MNDRAVRRVGVNLLWLVPGQVGGSEEYTVRLLRELAELHPDDVEVILYVNRQFRAAHPDLVSRFTTHVAPISGSSRILRVIVESTWLAARSRMDRCTLVHHAGGTMPSLRLAPGALTMHDLQPLSNPDRFGFVKGAYIRFVAPRSVRRARTVVCLSEFVASDVVNRVGIERERIRIIPCGVNEPETAFDHDRLAQLLASLDLTNRPFILYPAITYPHKNHETLVAAFAQIVSTHPELRLVFTGGGGSSDATVTAAIDAYGLTNYVVRTGRIPETDLDLLYRAATVMAFPSLYEGFGIPVLEAMSRGCPVVASAIGALPEVTGGAGELVNPLDVVGWANALGGLIDDPARRTVLVRLGFDRAKHFDWSTPAQSLLSLYREIR